MELKQIVTGFTGTENCTITPITNGLINTTYLVEDHNSGEKFILQKINRQVFRFPETVIHNHLNINTMLKNGDYPLQLVELKKALSGGFMMEDENGESWRILSFIEDTKTFFKIPDIKTAYESAKAVGCFLNTVNPEDLPDIQTPIPDFINFEKRIADYQTSLQHANEDLIKNAGPEIETMNELLFLPQKWIEMEKEGILPKRIIHGDPNVRNILFDKNSSPVAVIDLDTVTVSTILYDFGDMARSYTNILDEDNGNADNNFNPHIYRTVKDGFLLYLKEKLTFEELENLDYAAQTVIYIQAIRFLTDYLNGSIYYSTKYAEHNLDRTRNQLELLKGLRKYLKDD
ncbi:phosphotransferase enzyme family protein [Chryseobacterium shigense]|uniref:Aminoglycoside phosphotransferase (APT) family kinase protein n=1 Tax=Chryseobacterium shigense TaxID=297244 RepID=A0A841NES1_9FLAO|nr:aminoglycoside phosphotransferase family protein [Chryseobacterium shigense]MBB6370552.1 aminoglycoside phosphotransferase (APT) family kinase protein [Chryseobacterium shigense]